METPLGTAVRLKSDKAACALLAAGFKPCQVPGIDRVDACHPLLVAAKVGAGCWLGDGVNVNCGASALNGAAVQPAKRVAGSQRHQQAHRCRTLKAY